MIRAAQANPVVIALVTFVAIVVALWLIPLTPIPGWQAGLHWNYASHVLFILVPLIVMTVFSRSASEYGLRPTRWRVELVTGGVVALALILLPLLAEGLFGTIQLRRTGVGFIVSTLVFQLILVGFGEELLFRGFIQGELNRAFERRFRWGSLRFGWGLMITAVLFGVAHLLNSFNPMIGAFTLDFGALFLTSVIGLLLGFVREYFGSILAATLIHGGWDLTMSLVTLGNPGTFALGAIMFGIWMYMGHVVTAVETKG